MDRPMRAPPVLRAHQLDSMTNRIRCFLTDTSGVEITYPEIQKRFNIGKARSRDIIRNLTKEGFIESVHLVRVRPKGRAA